MTDKSVSLADLELGQTAKVLGIRGDDLVSQRLLEMGVTPGSSATKVGAAPLGDPIEFEVRNYRLSLRKEEASRVDVSVI